MSENFDKEAAYQQSLEELSALLEGESDLIAKMASINCVLKQRFPYFYWVGFYIHKDGSLIVGPYQGTLGCLHIPFGKGVCGMAAETLETQLENDVHAIPNHISCDVNSRSEIVVPVIDEEQRLLAVFDVDSDQVNAFDAVDRAFLEKIIASFFQERRNS